MNLEYITKNEFSMLKKITQKKFRHLYQKTILEGENLIFQLIESKVLPTEIYITEDYLNLKSLSALSNQILFKFIKYSQIISLTDTISPQKIIAVFNTSLKPIILDDNLLFLDDIQDPGNLGTIIRTAYGFGIDGLILTQGCCDPFNCKTVRSSLGTVFLLPIKIVEDDWIYSQNALKIIADTEYSVSLYDFKELKKPYILMIGSEGKGLKTSFKEIADIKLHIPMANNLESFNAAITTAIFLYHLKGL